jgi:hypothetical protein
VTRHRTGDAIVSAVIAGAGPVTKPFPLRPTEPHNGRVVAVSEHAWNRGVGMRDQSLGERGPAKSGSVIRQLSLDESAKDIELLDGIESGQFRVKLAPLCPHEANVFIKNTTDEPLTVALPKAAIGVPILPQISVWETTLSTTSAIKRRSRTPS